MIWQLNTNMSGNQYKIENLCYEMVNFHCSVRKAWCSTMFLTLMANRIKGFTSIKTYKCHFTLVQCCLHICQYGAFQMRQTFSHDAFLFRLLPNVSKKMLEASCIVLTLAA